MLLSFQGAFGRFAHIFHVKENLDPVVVSWSCSPVGLRFTQSARYDAPVAFLSRSHLEIEHYFLEPVVSDSSSFAVQVLTEELPQTEVEAGRFLGSPRRPTIVGRRVARVAQFISAISGHTLVALLSLCQRLASWLIVRPQAPRGGGGSDASFRCFGTNG